MARSRKQLHPMPRIPSGEVVQSPFKISSPPPLATNGHLQKPRLPPRQANGRLSRPPTATKPEAGAMQLVICVGGIYLSFLSWALLQERLTKTPYATTPDSIHMKPAQEYWKFPVFLNTIQSFFAFLSGIAYLYATSPKFRVFNSTAMIMPLLLVSITSSLASPFGYASLAHVDYLTFVLAKSCKLLPVMFLHITLFGKKYPLSKYFIVLAVTAGVAMFTVYHPPREGSSSKKNAEKSSYYGLALLSINLFLDGLTNTVQDHIFNSPSRYGPITGPQMMVASNLISTLLTTIWLSVTPYVPLPLLPAMAHTSTHEISSAVTFLQHHPGVLYDVLGFAACGAIGQLFIYATLERFSSILLVTVTVTRKMLTMLLSVLWFGKSLTLGQNAGIGLVFSGVAYEGYLTRQEKIKKSKLKTK